MTLSPGTHLGPYELIAPAGAGGMGEVYKARDTRLDRTVAIKVLPSEFAQNVELRHRLEREARAIASLNHPHICTLHDVGSQDGIDFLVMEYLEGETLASRLARGAIPLPQAVELAVPIADALDKAHRAGIVHRDLKPANIMLTKSGPKLLDFGLAKLRMPVKGRSLDSATPTEEKTAQGSLLGTLAYMAPEQLEGKEADARADVWALGAVLYEMVTGRRAFEGKSTAGLIAAILEHEAPALSHPLLNRVVQKCLAKDPDARFQSAGEVRELLRWVTEIQAKARTPTPLVQHWARAAWALAGAAAAMGILLYSRTVPVELPETRLEVVTPPTTDAISFALSPDGRSLVFVADTEGKSMLWLRALDSVAAAPVASTEGAAFPFWSPDSRSIGFFAEGKLKRFDLGGGPARVLADADIGRGGAWSREGVILYPPTPDRELYRVSEDGGEPGMVIRVNGQPRFPQFLSDQRQFVFYVLGGPENRGVYVGSLDSPETKKLFDADAAPVLGPSGFLFFVRDRILLARRFDDRALEAVGEPVSVGDELLVRSDAPLSGKAALAGSSTVLAYRTGTAAHRQFMWFDRSGKVLGTAGASDPATISNPEISPDGQRIAFGRLFGLDRGIWLLDSSRGTVNRFTLEEGRYIFPIWSPDGTALVFGKTRDDGVSNLYHKTIQGGREDLLLESPTTNTPCDWSRDGRFILYINRISASSRDLWALPLEGDRKPLPVMESRFDEREGQFAPDGNFVAYESNETGRFEIYVQPFPGPGEKSAVSTQGGEHPRWSPDGRELFYIAPDGSLMTVPLTAAEGKDLKLGSPAKLFSTRIVREATPGYNYNQQYDVSPDGKRFLINVTTEEAVTSPITLILNWKPPEKL